EAQGHGGPGPPGWSPPAGGCSRPAPHAVRAASNFRHRAGSIRHTPARPDGVPCAHLVGHPAGAPESRKGRQHAVTGLEQVVLFGAGIAAGTINTIVGSGTLLTFPTLLAFGYPP